MKIYLASRYSRFKQMQAVRDELNARGHEVTARWIEGNHQLSKEEIGDEAERKRMQFAVEDMNDLLEADCVISFTEEPRSTNSRGGRHVEFGIALGLKRRCIVIGHRENVFHCLPAVEFYPNLAQLWERL
jgi:nucleoside 2-deoxyribosyltransferase